ncbi:MAG: SGNH/GDSL hydrolase family protein [Bacteroidetes bacterium]|nr:SGNH/GDSL hydrolase family protein [Bacteroidota bacterium]
MKRNSFLLLFGFTSLAIMILAFKEKPKQVVCFGDSITYGARVDGHSWVWYLSQQHSNAADFVNAGRSGRRTSDEKELLPVLEKYPSADYYLIFLGVNDLKDGTDSMVNSCVEHMKWMIDAIRKVNDKAQIILLAPTDINLKTMDEVNVKKKYNDNTKQSLYKLEKRYKELSKQEHTGFISLLHTVSKPNYADGLHPNEDGQQEIAKAVWKKFKKIIH